MKYKEHLKGGKGDNTNPSDYKKGEMKVGKEIEREHTSNPIVASEISTDHESENDTYYDELVISGIADEPDAIKTFNKVKSDKDKKKAINKIQKNLDKEKKKLGMKEHIITKFEDYLNEMAEITKKGTKVFADGKPLKSLKLTDVDDNIGIMQVPEGVPFLGKPKGFTMIWFFDSKESVLKTANQEYDIVMFPPPMKYSFTASPIEDIWKKNKNRKGEEHFLGALEAYNWEDFVVIKMMSVRKGYRKNHINSIMIEKLKELYPGKKIKFWEPTRDGLEYMKKTHKPEEIQDVTYIQKEKD